MSEPENALGEIATQLPALPDPIRLGALKAFSQLLGGLGGYFAAWARRPTQAVENKTAAIALISKSLAQAAADKAASDPAMVEAAMQCWLPKEIRRAENKARIIDNTIEELQSVADGKHQGGEIDEDWLNSFERFCEDASSERMQKLWGKVLAGEIVRPGSFSKRTLRFIYELDSDIAEAFARISSRCINGQVVGKEQEDPSVFVDLLKLDSSGIVTGVGGMVSYSIKTTPPDYTFGFGGLTFGIVCKADSEGTVSIDATPLSPIGNELLSICPNPDEKAALKIVSNELRARKKGIMNKVGVTGVALCSVVKLENGGTRFHKLEHWWGEDPFENPTTETSG